MVINHSFGGAKIREYFLFFNTPQAFNILNKGIYVHLLIKFNS